MKYPDSPSAKGTAPTQWRAACTKPYGKSELSDDTFDSDENNGQQEGDNVDFDPKFEASCSPSEPHLLTQEDLNDFVRD